MDTYVVTLSNPDNPELLVTLHIKAGSAGDMLYKLSQTEYYRWNFESVYTLAELHEKYGHERKSDD